MREAEQFATADKARKDAIEAKNELETAIYSAEKSFAEYKVRRPAWLLVRCNTLVHTGEELYQVRHMQESAPLRDMVLPRMKWALLACVILWNLKSSLRDWGHASYLSKTPCPVMGQASADFNVIAYFSVDG